MISGTATKVTHILLIEHEKSHQDLVISAFRNDPEPFRVSVARNLREARQITERDLPDLIISAWTLPDGKGLDILVRTDGIVTVPLIILTRYGNEPLAVEIMKSGAIDYVVKSTTNFKEIPHIARRAMRDWENIQERKWAENAMRDSEKRLADIISFLPDAVLAIDNEGRIIAWNKAIEQMTGVAAEEMLGKGNYEYSLPFYGERRPILIDLILIKDEEIEKKYLNLKRDGNRISLEAYIPTLLGGKGAYLWGTASPLYDSADNRIGAIEIIRDITAQKKIVMALEKSEERFRHISGIITDFAYSCKQEMGGVFLLDWITEAVRTITGFPVNEILAMGCWRSIVVEEDLQVFDENIGVILPGRSSQFELRIRTKDGAIRWLRCFAECTNDPDCPGCNRLYGGCQDITNRKLTEKKLQESEHRSVMMLKAIPDMMFVISREGVYRDFSVPDPSFLAIPVDQILGTNIRDSGFLKESTDAIIYHIAEALRTKTPQLFEYELMIAGSKRQYEARIVALNKDDVLGIVRDITDRKQAEQIRKAYEGRLNSAMEIGSLAWWEMDLPDGVIRFDDRKVTLLSRSPEQFNHYTDFTALLHPEDYESAMQAMKDHLEGKEARYHAVYRILASDGNYLWFRDVGGVTSRHPDGSPATITGIVIDITTSKKSEEALRVNQARLVNAMDIANLANWEFDVATGMFTFDDRFYALYETTADLEGGNQMSSETYIREFVYPDDRPSVLAEIQKILATKDPDYVGRMEHRITPRDGSIRTIIVRYAPIMGPDGTVIRIYGANQDITDRILMESEIRSLNTALEERVKDRTEALVESNEKLELENAHRFLAEEKLQASYDEKVMLLKEIHHRVKNNLQIIISLLNLQSRYITDEKTLAAIRESQNRVKAMALVHEKLYRSEDIAHISLLEYIRFLGKGLFQFYDAKLRGILFKLEISDIDVDIDAAILLGLIINELITNSLKYAFPEGRTGEVSISVKKEGHTLNVLFHDTGIGIPADLDWRDAPSLGLRLVNTLVDQMDGTVELDRSAGTLFTIVLHEKESRGEK